MGKIRLYIAAQLRQKERLFVDHSTPKFLWVDSFPLFTPVAEDADKPEHALGQSAASQTTRAQWTATHHPFTAPHPDDYGLLSSEPGRVRGLHYDLVLDGCEVAGGSIRVHQHALQMKIFQDVLGMNSTQTDRFSHLTDALKYGCPPHGGAAIGFDRLLSIMFNTRSIRDVIAFPKNASGAELMVDSPSAITAAQRKEYHITIA